MSGATLDKERQAYYHSAIEETASMLHRSCGPDKEEYSRLQASSMHRKRKIFSRLEVCFLYFKLATNSEGKTEEKMSSALYNLATFA